LADPYVEGFAEWADFLKYIPPSVVFKFIGFGYRDVCKCVHRKPVMHTIAYLITEKIVPL